MPKRILILAIAALSFAWVMAPAIRGALLVRCARTAPSVQEEPLGAATEAVRFSATDGVRLAGWFLGDPSARGTVILVHGFKTSRIEMIERAAFLRAAHYAVLLYDGRGCGESDGTFGVGATEVRDVIGAARYVAARREPGSDRIAVLGLSLGAGDAVLAGAAHEPIRAVIADSIWPDESVQLSRMGTVPLGPIALPVPPYEAAVVDGLIGGRLADARPRDAISRISPRSLLLIHCAQDENATTPLEDAKAMFAAAGQPKDLWLAPSCGHAGAFTAHPDEYRRRVLTFLADALR